MSEELQVLQNIGAQKIYEATHIPIKHVQSMLHDSFEGFSKVQFLGFISILEREYQLDLSELKNLGLIYFSEKKEKSINKGLFVVSKKKKRDNFVYLMLITVIFIIAIILKFAVYSETMDEKTAVNNTIIESVKEKIKPLAIINNDNNLTQDVNETVVLDINTTLFEEETVEPEAVEKSFQITSKSKVWFGYIDVKTNKHYQGTMKGTKDLDPSKTWLLLFGHGYVNMYINGEIQKFSSREKVRFLYKNNKLTAISVRKFKKLNKGRKW